MQRSRKDFFGKSDQEPQGGNRQVGFRRILCGGNARKGGEERRWAQWPDWRFSLHELGALCRRKFGHSSSVVAASEVGRFAYFPPSPSSFLLQRAYSNEGGGEKGLVKF